MTIFLCQNRTDYERMPPRRTSAVASATIPTRIILFAIGGTTLLLLFLSTPSHFVQKPTTTFVEQNDVTEGYRSLCSSSTEHQTSLGWEIAGPTTYVNQWQDDHHTRLTAAAAVQQVVQAVDNTWFIASVNGGVWRTTNIDALPSRVHWENVLDGQPVTCSSMSALHVSRQSPWTIYAGCGGSTSGEQGSDWNVVNSGDWGGVMISKDVGHSWQMLPGFPENYYVTAILEFKSDHEMDGGTTLLVAAQSHLWNRDDGGIWRSEDGGESFVRVSHTSTFTLNIVDLKNRSLNQTAADESFSKLTTVLATHSHSSTQTASFSKDGGRTFVDLPLPWDDGAIPFYTCATQLVGGTIVIGGLTTLPGGFPNHTDSQLFVLEPKKATNLQNIASSTASSSWSWMKLEQPMPLDQDGMPKDRMALLADPLYEDLLYVAGNAGALAWRVNLTTGVWTQLWDKPDVLDESIPHGDCRNFAWNSKTEELLLVSDGGIFARRQPRSPGGRWVSLNGDYSALELLSAHYDHRDDRYVAGAQDNCAIVTNPNASARDSGLGFVMGDGTVTLVDSNANPSRLFGTTQFLGVGTIENDPKATKSRPAKVGQNDGDDDDEGCGGLCFVHGDKFIQVEVEKYFPKPSYFPYFVHPFTLNRQDSTKLHFWVNATESAIYEFDIPYSVEEKDDIGPPTKVLDTGDAMILDFVSGGFTNGVADPTLIIAISNTHLFVRSGVNQYTDGEMVTHPLPLSFALPVSLQYDDLDNGKRILGPLTHARTVFMSVLSSDSRVVAVTGWTSIDDNLGEESIFVTLDAGEKWWNVTGNLRSASGVSGKVRPGGLLLVDVPSTMDAGENRKTIALLAGSSNGVYVTFVSDNECYDGVPNVQLNQQEWARFGTCGEFPIVLVADIEHEPISDRLVVATYGRGIFILKDAIRKLRQAWTRFKWQENTVETLS